MENRTANLKVGDKVYLARSGSWTMYFRVGTVVKRTATTIDVQVGDSAPDRFRIDGQRQGGDRYNDWSIDTHFTFEQRAALIAQDERTQQASHAITAIKPKDGINPRWGKDGLQAEVARLEALLADAKAKVEAI